MIKQIRQDKSSSLTNTISVWSTKRPTNKAEIQSFITAITRHRQDIPNYYETAKILIGLTFPKMKFEWTYLHEYAYLELIVHLTRQAILIS